ncbi:MAG: chemotaxis protein CheC [Candidatus Theseobacter exili]|nr:chemotaxis protein CheC [Candidatus Theseobacter exili]
MTEIKPDYFQLDAFKEIGSIGGCNAATSLSVMLDKKVDIGVPTVVIESIENIPHVLLEGANIINAVCFSVIGQISGSIFLVFSPPESLILANLLTGRKTTQTENLDEIEMSALNELGNIIVGTYLSALNQVLKMKVEYSVPEFISDMLKPVLTGIVTKLSLKTDYVVIVKNEFMIEKKMCKIPLIFIPDSESLNTILETLGKGEK